MSLEISLTLILEQQIISHRKMDNTREKVEIHPKLVITQSEAEQAQRTLASMEAPTTEESLNLDKELKTETRKHQEVQMLCSITRGRWISLEIL